MRLARRIRHEGLLVAKGGGGAGARGHRESDREFLQERRPELGCREEPARVGLELGHEELRDLRESWGRHGTVTGQSVTVQSRVSDG